MHKKLILGSVLALTLTLTSPVVAAEEMPFTWPSVDVVEWVFDLLEIFELESSSMEIGSAIDPGEEEGSSTLKMGPGLEPGGDEEPTAEMGPLAEPGG